MGACSIMRDGGTPFRNAAYTENPEALLSDEAHQIVDTHWQDQSTEAIIAYFNQVTNTTTLDGALTLNDKIIEVTSATGISAGTYLILFDPVSIRFSTFFVTVVAGTTITLDSPVDFPYPDGTNVDVAIVDLSVNGAVTPQVFGLRGTGAPPGVELTFHVTRIIFECLLNTSFKNGKDT